MKKIKLAIFDIDNTLLPAGHLDFSPKTKQALDSLRQNGIQILVATGRHFKFLQECVKDNLKDYIVTINGACLNDAQGNVICYDTMDIDTLNQIVRLCEQNEIGLGLKFKDNIVSYVNHNKFVKEYVSDEKHRQMIIDDTVNKNYHEKHGLPCGMFLIGDDAVIQSFEHQVDGVIFAYSYKGGCDAFLRNVNKSTGIEKYLKLKNISWDECIAFGDAENDIPMIQSALIGVTFSNVRESVKKSSDYITIPCEEDGIYKALKYFALI